MAKEEETKFAANRALADELHKRQRFIDKALEQVIVGNYNSAKKLLNKVVYEPFSVEIIEQDYGKKEII